MRYPRPRRKQRRTKTIIMTGGLNEIVTSLELKEGELHQVLNYMEVDSPYHGYASVQGYEVYDGKTSPSDVSALAISDEGNDEFCVLLLEGPTGPTNDISQSDHYIENRDNVATSQLITKFEGGSLRFSGPGPGDHLVVFPNTGGSFASAFDESFDRIEIGASPTLNGDFTIDMFLRPNTRPTVQYLFEKPGCYRCSIDEQGYIKFETSVDSFGYDTSIEMQSEDLSPTVFTHISITSRDKVLRMAVDGNPIENEFGEIIEVPYPGIFNSGSKVWIGSDYQEQFPYDGFMDELRFSIVSRWYHAFEIPEWRYSSSNYQELNWYDKEREDQRAAITPVPGSGPVRGVHIYKGEVYALRDTVLGDAGAIYRANRVLNPNGTVDDDASGWELIDNRLNPGGRMEAVNWRFSGSFADQEVMCIVDGASVPRIYDKATETMYEYDNAESIDIPDRDPVDPRYAKHVAIFDNRLVLGYELDDIFLSSKTDPRDFTGGFGDTLLIGDDITNFRELPGESLGIFCRNSIKVLKKIQTPTSNAASPDFSFQVENFSRQSGAIEWSVERVLDKILYADDRGIVDFSAVDKYGDFDAMALSKKLNRIFLAKKPLITTALVDKEINQYRLFFSDNTSIWFTFHENKLKGGTFVAYNTPVHITTEGEDPEGYLWKFFCSDDGYVYQMDSGTSFNGEDILTELFTAYYHYGSPRRWKSFYRLIFEITAARGQQFAVRPVFDYDSSDFPETNWWDPILKGFAGRWGIDEWGFFVWGGAEIQRAIHYTRGTGTNMSIEMRTGSKYNTQHIIHNCIVDFDELDMQE
jgi:hypothetical protein